MLSYKRILLCSFSLFLLFTFIHSSQLIGGETNSSINPKTGFPYRTVDIERLEREIDEIADERLGFISDYEAQEHIKNFFCRIGPAVLNNHTTDEARRIFLKGARRIFKTHYSLRAYKRAFDFPSCNNDGSLNLSDFLFGPQLTADEIAPSIQDLHEVMIQEYTHDTTHHRTAALLSFRNDGAGYLLMQRALQADPQAAAEGVVLFAGFFAELRLAVEKSIEIEKDREAVFKPTSVELDDDQQPLLQEPVGPVNANKQYPEAAFTGSTVLRIRILEFFHNMQVTFSAAPSARLAYGMLDTGLLGIVATPGDARLSYLATYLLANRMNAQHHLGYRLACYWAISDISAWAPMAGATQEGWVKLLNSRRYGLPNTLSPTGSAAIEVADKKLSDYFEDAYDDYYDAVNELFENPQDIWKSVVAGATLPKLPTISSQVSR